MTNLQPKPQLKQQDDRTGSPSSPQREQVGKSDPASNPASKQPPITANQNRKPEGQQRGDMKKESQDNKNPRSEKRFES